MHPYEPVYRAAHYRVNTDPAFVLRIGEHSPPLANLYRQHRVDCAAFVTAWNPHSQLLSAAENRQRNVQLETLIRQAGFCCMAGIGTAPDGDWPSEDSFLVLGISREAACQLGQQFAQHAIVFCGANAVPTLVWMAPDYE